jgi:hypothetical protein
LSPIVGLNFICQVSYNIIHSYHVLNISQVSGTTHLILTTPL